MRGRPVLREAVTDEPAKRVLGLPAPRCWTTIEVPVVLNECPVYYLKFDTKRSFEDGFVVHLGSVAIDGVAYAVPPIKFCYVPAEVRFVAPRV